MSDLKTKPTSKSVKGFLDSIENDQKRADAFKLLEIMESITKEKPKMWGDSMIGFGTYHYKYDSGREGDWFITGFSPRKQNLSLYIMAGFSKYQDYLAKLGKHKTGSSCLYVNKLADVDEEVLKNMIRDSVEYMKNKYK